MKKVFIAPLWSMETDRGVGDCLYNGFPLSKVIYDTSPPRRDAF